MRVININPTTGLRSFSIGRRGENAVTEVLFNYSQWVNEFGTGVCSLRVKRHGDTTAYPVVLSCANGVAAWLVSSTDTDCTGRGLIEYVFTVGEQIVKSILFETEVLPDIGKTTETPPDPYETWIDELTELGVQTQQYAQAAEAAADAVLGMRAEAETLAPGSSATASYESGVLTLGIPRGEQGIQGPEGEPGRDGANGSDGAPGADGFSPTVETESIQGGTRVTITDADGDHSFDVMNGQTGATGPQGETGAQGPKGDTGATGAQGPQGETGPAGVGVPSGGTTGQVLKKKSGTNYDTEWADESGGGGGASDYSSLTNKPQINGNTLSGNKTTAQLGLDQTFVATYTKANNSVTCDKTYSEIATAYQAGKTCIAIFAGAFALTGQTADVYVSSTSLYAVLSTPLGGQYVIHASDGTITSDRVFGQEEISVSGIVKGDGQGNFSAAVAGTDYLASMPSASDVGAVAVAQGVGHAGEFVVVGSDGNITTVTMTAWQGGSY